jgi:hypothetical protein
MRHTPLGILALLLLIIGNVSAQNTSNEGYSYELSEYLLTLTRPSAPAVFDGQVIFTAPSSYRRAGVAFAHENWTKIHWFRKLELPIDNVDPFVEKSKTPRQFYHDSGIMFTVYPPPPDMALLEYRLIVDGLWIADPLNNTSRLDAASGIQNSLVHLNPEPAKQMVEAKEDGLIHFRWQTEPGEAVFLTGSFNNWDPFMYLMDEDTPGCYRLSLALPAGTYQYAFFYQGKYYNDLSNPERVYLFDGRIVSVLSVSPPKPESMKPF